MDTFVISGGKQLSGELRVNGAKNHALKMIPACFLCSDTTTIQNVPRVEDVSRLLEIVEHIGGRVNQEGNSVRITPPEVFSGDLPIEIVPKLRASIVLVGPLLARYGRVRLPHPGGCNLGKRPIDLFIKGFEALGAQVHTDNDAQLFEAPQGLRGCRFTFPIISVTGTETLMMAAVLAEGVTTLENAACEPEIIALAEYLNAHGANISGAGTSTMVITGLGQNGRITAGVADIIPDRIEAGSFVILAAATQSPLTITHCNPAHLRVPLQILETIGVYTTTTESTITVQPSDHMNAHDIVTHEYPGFPTDLQAPMTVLLTQAHGQSLVRETIYDGRLFYTDTLNTLGAKITLIDSYRAQVNGPTALRGKMVVSPDIRAGIALVIAGLMAKGQTIIDNIYQIDRGYEHIEQRLANIGADITRVTE